MKLTNEQANDLLEKLCYDDDMSRERVARIMKRINDLEAVLADAPGTSFYFKKHGDPIYVGAALERARLSSKEVKN